MAYTGRCWYCGSEDVEEFSDGSHECLECGMTWGGRKYVQQPVKQLNVRHTYSNTGESPEMERAMRPYREKWKNNGKISTPKRGIVNNGTKWYDAEVHITNNFSVPAVAYFIFAVLVYGTLGILLYAACSS